MTSFEEADTNGDGSIKKPEWDKLLIEDKRRRIEDEDAHRDQTRRKLQANDWSNSRYGR